MNYLIQIILCSRSLASSYQFDFRIVVFLEYYLSNFEKLVAANDLTIRRLFGIIMIIFDQFRSDSWVLFSNQVGSEIVYFTICCLFTQLKMYCNLKVRAFDRRQIGLTRMWEPASSAILSCYRSYTVAIYHQVLCLFCS